MPTYQDYIAQGMSPNQAALQAQMVGAPGGQRQMMGRGQGGALPTSPVSAPAPGGLPQAGPGQIMHGNQPGVPTATGGSMSITTNPAQMGADRFTTNVRPNPNAPDAMKILSNGGADKQAAGEAAFRALYGTDPTANDYGKQVWSDGTTNTPPGPGGAATNGQRFMPTDDGLGGAKPQSGGYTLEGFDSNKLGNAGHTSPKYQIGRVLQNFDPKAGVTPELLAELNKLGIGTFERLSGDKIRVSGNVDPRFEGYTTIDLVRGFNGPGGGQAWQYGADNGSGGGGGGTGAAMAAGGGGGTPSSLGIASLLSGDPLQRIQQAIGQINGQGQVNLDALLRQLQGV